VRVIVDSGGAIAAMNTAEPRHKEFYGVLSRASAAVISPLVIAEVHYLLNAGGVPDAAAAFLEDVAGGFYEIAAPVAEDYAQAARLIVQYEGKMERKRRKPGSLDLADAVNVVLAQRHATSLLLATDQDYRHVMPLTGHPYFRILPYDLDQ
jgi:predicted nucleic acid-binding protein